MRPQLGPSGIVREAPEIERDWLAPTARNMEAEKSHCTYLSSGRFNVCLLSRR